MMAIADIYAHFGLAEASKPHCFSLENIAELLIPEQSEDTATIIHILPLAQQITVSQIEALIKAFEKRDRDITARGFLLRKICRAIYAFIFFHPMSATKLRRRLICCLCSSNI